MKKKKKNSHCPVQGCRTRKPHLSVIAGLHGVFSKPELLAEFVKQAIYELGQSAMDDVNNRRFFAYLTRWRQPEELYFRSLYILFVADKAEIPHIISCELPNSFSAIWKAVNQVVFDGKGTLDQKRVELNGEEFSSMKLLNDCAHASFRTMATSVSFAQNPEFLESTIEKHKANWMFLCDNLDHIKKCFKAGKSRAEVLSELKQLYGMSSPSRKSHSFSRIGSQP